MKRHSDQDIVGIEASVRARELRVNAKPRTRITTVGHGQVVTRRRGLPPAGAVPGVTYRDVEAAVAIESGPHDLGGAGEQQERTSPTLRDPPDPRRAR